MTASHPLAALAGLGQSPWLDFISRDFVASGKLAKLVAHDNVGGVTSNPAIFEKAIASGSEYEDALRALAADTELDANAIYESLAIADIQAAADELRVVYDRTNGRDGFVSLEVSPYLANDAQGTIIEARRLWAEVDRPNLMVKIPGTDAGVIAIRQVIEDGININVTLLFAIDAYQAVAESYVAGLEARQQNGLPIDHIASVASFFVSRIDAVMDKKIDTRLKANDPASETLKTLRGQIAIANAKAAYKWFEDFSASPRWQILAAHGAAPQRLLWASTGTKDLAYSDVLYVNTLIGEQTVNTLPPATMDAFRDHGTAAITLRDDLPGALKILADAQNLGLDLPAVTKALVADGVKQFAQAADRLLAAVESRRAAALHGRLSTLKIHLPADLAAEHAASLTAWQDQAKPHALWARDAALWTNTTESAWLGWLQAPAAIHTHLAELQEFAASLTEAGFTDVLLLAMGGSSLGPEVIGHVLAHGAHTRTLHVLDSTNPDQITRILEGLNLTTTLVIVASKSGTTLEPCLLETEVFASLSAAVSPEIAAHHFAAITDPGTALANLATQKGYRKIFYGCPDIGGRFSVLSPFGLAVAAAIGVEIDAINDHALRMAATCAALTPATTNPGIQLGTALGIAAKAGRDKLTLLIDPGLAPLGAWLEQLIAESTGKHGFMILPINGEDELAANGYGADRIFAAITLASTAKEPRLKSLIEAGQPVLHLALNSAAELPQQFFLWEIATAVAGAILGINPFDQPDVEAAKIETRALTDALRATGTMPPLAGTVTFDSITLHAPGLKTNDLATLADALNAHLATATRGDYVAVLAYIDQNLTHCAALAQLRSHLGRATRAATIVQFGPRFLHSTGQAFKGGPNSGIFIQITADPIQDIKVPGENFSFGQICEAQARGDFAVLHDRGRRILNLHLTGDIYKGLQTLNTALDFSRES